MFGHKIPFNGTDAFEPLPVATAPCRYLGFRAPIEPLGSVRGLVLAAKFAAQKRSAPEVSALFLWDASLIDRFSRRDDTQPMDACLSLSFDVLNYEFQ